MRVKVHSTENTFSLKTTPIGGDGHCPESGGTRSQRTGWNKLQRLWRCAAAAATTLRVRDAADGRKRPLFTGSTHGGRLDSGKGSGKEGALQARTRFSWLLCCALFRFVVSTRCATTRLLRLSSGRPICLRECTGVHATTFSQLRLRRNLFEETPINMMIKPCAHDVDNKHQR